MASDEYLSRYCIGHHTSHENITEIIRIHGALIGQQATVVRLRIALNVLAVFNVVIPSIVFGGLFVINTMSCIRCICLIVAQYIDQIHRVVLLESVVAIVGTIIAIQSC
jgi:hypothetical protein